MNIPEGMEEKDVLKIIETICNRISPKYTFYGYTIDDIKQESFIICVEALNRYDGIRPLENFLSVNLSNRLKTFMRDNYFIGTSNEDRKKLVQPAQLDHENSLIDSFSLNSEYAREMNTDDMVDAIDKNIPSNMRMDYLKILNDIYIPKPRKEEVLETVTNILREHGHYEEEG